MIRNLKFIILGLSAWLTLVGPVCASGPADELIKEANHLFSQFKDNEALTKYHQILLKDPQHYEALYKTGLLHIRIGARYSDETEKTEYFSAAKGYAQKALEVNPDGADALYVMALAQTNCSMVGSARERIISLKEIKKTIDKALLSNPQHAGAWQLMGRWQYKAANLNFIECTASKLLCGGIPDGASNQNAIQALKNSISYNPHNISGYYDLAIIYRDMKSKSESIAILKQALRLNLLTTEDLEISRRCKSLLKEIGGSMDGIPNNTSLVHSRI